MKGYRSLKVKSVRETNPPGESLRIDFKDSIVSFQIQKQSLEELGLENLSAGDIVEIKGRKGNTDNDLLGIDVLEDIKKA